MSHFTTLDLEIKSIEALRRACDSLKLSLVEKGVARGYGGRTMPGEYVIHLNGPYDIALNKRKDGVYAVTADWWGGHVAKAVGPACGLLKQAYGASAATLAARRLGMSAVTAKTPNGNLVVTITGYK